MKAFHLNDEATITSVAVAVAVTAVTVTAVEMNGFGLAFRSSALKMDDKEGE